MKILLHIGQPKTGTSAIQTFLSSNRKALRMAGVLYPSVRVKGLVFHLRNHNRVANALNNMPSVYPHLTASQYFEQFYVEAQRIGAERVILSAENFFAVDQWRFFANHDERSYLAGYRNKLENLSTYLRGHQVDILVYLRSQVEWVSSMIAHLVRYRVGRADLSDHEIFEFAKPHLQYTRLLDQWNEIIKPASLTAVHYSPDNLCQGSRVSDFAHRVKLEHCDIRPVHKLFRVNISLSPEYVVIKRTLNRTPRRSLEERIVVECLLRLSRRSRRRGMYCLDSGVVEEIVEYVREDNARLVRTYMSPDTLFEHDVSLSDNRFSRLTAEDIEQAERNFDKEYRGLRIWLLRGLYLSRATLSACFPKWALMLENQASALRESWLWWRTRPSDRVGTYE